MINIEDPKIKINQIVHGSSIYGPGYRTVIWVQGCTLACKGCWNQDLWTKKGGTDYLVSQLMELIEQSGDEGVTLLGGEPLEQSDAIFVLLNRINDLGLSIFLYSGFEENELNEKQRSCVEMSDIVVLGRYVEELRDTTLRWRGSSNQSLHFPSNRYADMEFEEQNEVEVRLDEDGTIQIIGYPDSDFVSEFMD